MKCRYNRCLYGGDVLESEAVEVAKGRYMHRECARYSKTIKAIIDYYVKNIDETVVVSNLHKVINTIVFDRHNDPDLLMYVIRRASASGKKIKSPFALYYLVKDDECVGDWKERQAEKLIRQNKIEINIKPTTKYKYTPSPPLTLERIIDNL